MVSQTPLRRFRSSDFILRHSMVGIMIVVAVVLSVLSPYFLTTNNLRAILIASAPFALISIGQTLVILTAGIDLSVGSVIALSAMVSGSVAVRSPDMLWPAFLAGIACGICVGLVNGFLVVAFRITPFVATLATLAIASGLAYAVGGGAPIVGMPDTFGDLANTAFLGLPFPVWIMLFGLLFFGIILHRFGYGIALYAIGGNVVAARIAGIRVRVVTFSVYVISGTLAGISGVLIASRVVSASPSMGSGYELDSIAAVVIGGASLFGGHGTMWGTAIGLSLIQILNNGLDLIQVPSYWQNVVKGVLIAIAVGVDAAMNSHRK